MWRAIFLAIGIALCLLGLECVVVEKAVLADSVAPPAPILAADGTFTVPGTAREIEVREWMPFSFVGAGIVIILYTVTIPRRIAP
jgi:hypothetical protein